MRLPDLRILTVDRFPGSTRRPMLFIDLERLVNDLDSMSMVCELWVNGSFLTEKDEPDDIDLSFSAFVSDVEILDMAMQDWILTNLNGNKRYSRYLDTFICFRYPREHPNRRADLTGYWTEKWGVGWDDRLKGYAVIKLGESDVGHRLCA